MIVISSALMQDKGLVLEMALSLIGWFIEWHVLCVTEEEFMATYKHAYKEK